MQHSTNFNMNLPEGYDQFDIGHFNDNTRKIDTELKKHKDVCDNITNFEKKLEGTLALGATEIQFTDSSITSNSYIDVYTSVYGANPKDMTVTGNTCTLTFDALLQAIQVALVVKNWRTE